MNILTQLTNLKNKLLEEFEKEIDKEEEIDQIRIENVIREHQGGYKECDHIWAKRIIDMLWRYHKYEIKPLFKIVNPDNASIEVKDIFQEAKKLE